MIDEVEKHLQSAIKVMRDACDDAERRLSEMPPPGTLNKYGTPTQERANTAQQVMHRLCMGDMNARLSIMTALSCLESEHTQRYVMAQIKAEQKAGKP